MKYRSLVSKRDRALQDAELAERATNYAATSAHYNLSDKDDEYRGIRSTAVGALAGEAASRIARRATNADDMSDALDEYATDAGFDDEEHAANYKHSPYQTGRSIDNIKYRDVDSAVSKARKIGGVVGAIGGAAITIPAALTSGSSLKRKVLSSLAGTAIGAGAIALPSGGIARMNANAANILADYFKNNKEYHLGLVQKARDLYNSDVEYATT